MVVQQLYDYSLRADLEGVAKFLPLTSSTAKRHHCPTVDAHWPC